VNLALTLAAALTLTSPAFHAGARIPAQYTCDGADVSPPLRWTKPPAGTLGFRVKVEDVDAPGGTFVHWTASGIPAASRGLRRGQHAPREGVNGIGTRGYTGPCPPPGPPHRYVFTLTAVGRDGRELAQARLVGRYARG
jgi:Raf kinase inhibitor-like YbhB/YbcL family protein